MASPCLLNLLSLHYLWMLLWNRLTLSPSPIPLLGPLLEFPSSRTLSERVKTTTQGRVIPEVRDSEAVETLPNSTLAEVVSVLPTSIAKWRLRQ